MGYIRAQTSPSKTTKTLLVLCLTTFDTWHMYICAMVDPANCHSCSRLWTASLHLGWNHLFFLILFIFLLSNFDTFYRLDNICFRRPVLLWPACFRSVLLRPACFIRPVLLRPTCFIRPVLLGPACFIRPVLLGPVCFRRIILLRPAHFRRLVLLWPACFRRPVLLWLTYLERASSFKPQVNPCLT